MAHIVKLCPARTAELKAWIFQERGGVERGEQGKSYSILKRIGMDGKSTNSRTVVAKIDSGFFCH